MGNLIPQIKYELRMKWCNSLRRILHMVLDTADITIHRVLDYFSVHFIKMCQMETVQN
jgi:hypothetical protein